MVYLHHKSVIYDEMLYQFLLSKDSKTRLPSAVDEYLEVDDYWLRNHLLRSKNHWARRIVEHKPYKMLLEVHSDSNEEARNYADKLEGQLIKARINYFRSSSSGLLSKYQQMQTEKHNQIYIIYRDPRFISSSKPGIASQPLSEATELFARYKNKRIIDRLYAETELR
jgi:HD superfamily phosphohydrolase